MLRAAPLPLLPPFIGHGTLETKARKVFTPSSGSAAGKAQPDQIDTMPEKIDWAAGDHCRAVFREDGIEYEGTIGSIDTNGEGYRYANILYIGYNNEETQWLTELKPSRGEAARLAQVREATEGGEPDDTVGKKHWVVGEYCRATFTKDRTEYEGKLTSIEVDSNGNKYGLVVYLGFKKEETQWLDDLKPSDGDTARLQQVKNAGGENDQVVLKWLAPRILKITDKVFREMRITAVDGAFQLYGHLRSSARDMRKMKGYFRHRYELLDQPEDSKEEWRLGEACVAKLQDTTDGNDNWYRAQVVELDEWNSEAGIIYVDLGTVRTVKYADLRIARAFGDKVCDAYFNFTNQSKSRGYINDFGLFQPILAIRMVLESIIPPNGHYSYEELEKIQKELVYWNAPPIEIAIARREVTSFPIPIKLYYRNYENHTWDNYATSLVERGLANYGSVDLWKFDYLLHARGIDVAGQRLRGL